MKNCPLCHSSKTISLSPDFSDCQVCSCRFRIQFLTKGEEKSRYLEHNNDVEDERYQKFVSPITNAILSEFSSEDKGLDFGAGPGPVIAKVLEDNNYKITKYDPFFHNTPEVLNKTYNYIACCEVIEHFHNPDKEFKLLKKLLKPGGKLYCMTHLYEDSIDFTNWYYKNDPTHVIFFRKETVAWIKEEFGFKDSRVKGRLIVFAS